MVPARQNPIQASGFIKNHARVHLNLKNLKEDTYFLKFYSLKHKRRPVSMRQINGAPNQSLDGGPPKCEKTKLNNLEIPLDFEIHFSQEILNNTCFF